MAQLTGMRVLVTGSEGAFGSAVTRLLEQAGADVVGLDRTPGASGRSIACDIRDAEAVASAVSAAVERLGGLDVLVNNAGIGTAGSIGEGFGQVERDVLDTNVLGTWNVTRAALPSLLASDRRPHVVNVASLLAVLTFPRLGSYTASKRAVCAISDTLRAEHRADGLTVSTVYPGYVATPIHTPGEERSGMSFAGRVPEESVDQVARTIVRAIRRRPRDTATSFGGQVALRAARHLPRLVDRIVGRRFQELLEQEAQAQAQERPTREVVA